MTSDRQCPEAVALELCLPKAIGGTFKRTIENLLQKNGGAISLRLVEAPCGRKVSHRQSDAVEGKQRFSRSLPQIPCITYFD